MSDYRINVRFRDDNEAERRAAEYLKTLHRSRNQFVVDAVLARKGDLMQSPRKFIHFRGLCCVSYYPAENLNGSSADKGGE